MLRTSLAVIASLGLIQAQCVLAGNPFRSVHELLFGPRVTQTAPSARELARAMDQIEKCLDLYGTVAAKKPDVWGEARLTRYRTAFDKEMESDVSGFKDVISAYLRRNDAAFFGNATALSIPATTGSIGAVNVSNLISEVTPGNALTVPRTGFSKSPGTLGLEPVLHLDQKARYLNHLNTLRRINDGGDLSDSPGYSLYLLRIPVSITPGTVTREGYGAESVFTIYPYIDANLLPQVFRDLVINDLTDQLTSPVHFMLSNEGTRNYFKDRVENVPLGSSIKPRVRISNDLDTENAQTRRIREQATAQVKKYRNFFLPSSRNRHARFGVPPSLMVSAFGDEELLEIGLEAYRRLGNSGFQKTYKTEFINPADVQDFLASELEGAYELLSSIEMRNLWKTQNHQVPQDMEFPWESLPHYPVVTRSFPCLLDEIALATKGGYEKRIEQIRLETLADFRQVYSGNWSPLVAAGAAVSPNTRCIDCLTWAVLVESALLDQQLREDIRNRGYQISAETLRFYGPDPSLQARNAFVDYVRARWPVHVFTVEPSADDQNVQDIFSSRRELQLAAAIAFTNGYMSGNNLSKFVRRLEMDVEAWALNRTIVGFAHGNDTFGWKFYPRVQTPETPGNVKVFFRDLWRGGPTRDEMLQERRLEPGIRECEVMVIMPSFVPFVTVDVRTDWFELTKPDQKIYSLEASLNYSQITERLRLYSEQVGDWAYYRERDQFRMKRQLDQLISQLPMQSYSVEVPFENTNGGFEIFATGVTDLAPELLGFYGAPGIGETTGADIFLVGNNFSIHETSVIAGNVYVKPEVISRQLLRISITDKEAKELLSIAQGGMYLIHVATPYGVSQPLKVPLVPQKEIPPPPEEPAGLFWKPDKINAVVEFDPNYNPLKVTFPDPPTNPPELALFQKGNAPFLRPPSTAKLNMAFFNRHEGKEKQLGSQVKLAVNMIFDDDMVAPIPLCTTCELTTLITKKIGGISGLQGYDSLVIRGFLTDVGGPSDLAIPIAGDLVIQILSPRGKAVAETGTTKPQIKMFQPPGPNQPAY